MTHDRPYRAALGLSEARDELLRHRGAQFDPDLVDLFLQSIDEPPPPDVEVDAVTRGLRLFRSDA
jgi:HD-GYP domain-containing protein (c-di-GMP phosphodiesterase class II)